MVWFRENWYEEVLRQLGQGLAKCHAVAFENRGAGEWEISVNDTSKKFTLWKNFILRRLSIILVFLSAYLKIVIYFLMTSFYSYPTCGPR